LRQAKTCAENIVASYRGEPKKPFGFTGLGKLGSLGRRSAVAEILGFRFKGLFAWLLWRGVYVTKFPGLDGQLRLIADWILDVFLPRDITQLRLFHSGKHGAQGRRSRPRRLIFHKPRKMTEKIHLKITRNYESKTLHWFCPHGLPTSHHWRFKFEDAMIKRAFVMPHKKEGVIYGAVRNPA
jgi:NDH2 C-terminal domain